MGTSETIRLENDHTPPFFNKLPISIERGEGVYVWDEEGNRYMDFTAGWGVTCLGHSHPVIVASLHQQAQKILQNPNSGLTYSPVRARLLELMSRILPANLTSVFFGSNGAEVNDAAIKLVRKVTGRMDVISTANSFHGRTISTASATGQAKHREKFNPLMPNYRFVPYDNLSALEQSLDDHVAAVILEPIQGEGGVRVPADHYLPGVSRLCKANGSLLIVDEIQTGFCRTGPMFAISPTKSVETDFLTMAKGIAGGFPFAAFAVTDAVAARFEVGDHGGTYCGNPLGCAVALAVIEHLVEKSISENVQKVGGYAIGRMKGWRKQHPDLVRDIRGRGLLLLVEFRDEETATRVNDCCLQRGLFVRQTQGTSIRVFPALNITETEMAEGLDIMEKAIADTEKLPRQDFGCA